jgi:ATP-dependent helicase/DNAse subunit B
MALTLLAGPASSGKVASLLDRYLRLLERDPVLIVPNRSDVDRIERDLLRRSPALMGGSIGTFDDVFRELARGDGGGRRVITDAQRALVLRRVVARVSLNGLTASSRFPGFGDALGSVLGELESGLVDPADLEREDLAALYVEYRAELDRLGVWDRDLERRRAAERVGSELDAWDGRAVFAYGFEDLTGAEWALLEALAARAEVTVSLAYEPGRPAFDSLQRTAADLASLAGGRIEELPARAAEFTPPGLAYLERALFADSPPEAPQLSGELRFLEGAGTRGTLELVAEEILGLIRDGTPAEEIVVVFPNLDAAREPLETVLSLFGVPYALEARSRLPETPYGRALLSLLRFAWTNRERRDLYGFLRSPYSGLTRSHVDYLEGRLRGRAVRAPERVEEETVKLRGKPIPRLAEARSEPPLEAVRNLAEAMLRLAHGVEAPPVGEQSRLDLAAYEAVARVVRELEAWERMGQSVSREEMLAALERASVRTGSALERGRVHVLDLMRARTRSYRVVFALGLEQGGLPRRPRTSPFLDDDARTELDRRKRGARLARPDHTACERYLFYTLCTRAQERFYLVREAAGDEGTPKEAGPFWDEVCSLFPRVEAERWTTRRRLSALTWPVDRSPTERERLRAAAALVPADPDGAAALADANGWSRRLERARAAFDRPTRLRHPAVVNELAARESFNVTELESFATCSSIWFIERAVSPRTIDNESDARLRGQVAHSALHKFFSGLPKRLGTERVEPGRVEEAVSFMDECLDEALESGVWIELTDVERRELDQALRHDLEHFVRREAELALPLVPRRFEVLFGMERAAPELQRGLELDGFSLAGRIDRIDVDPLSARGIVQDYKSGKTAWSAAKIRSELKLQIPLYMLVLRDLVGVEPLGGLYRALSGERTARGLLSTEAKDLLPDFPSRDYLGPDEFWEQVDEAAETATQIVGRIRSGDVVHDPQGGECPTWCRLGPLCRVERA